MTAGSSSRSRAATVSWCLFDFANSSYTTLIITVAFAVFFRDVVVNAADNRADQLWGVANFLSMLIVAVASPVIGALADYSGRKKLFLIATTLLAVVATALLSLAGTGDIAWAMALFVAGTVGFEAGYVFYNAFLPDVSTPATVGRVSGWGWAVGYAGGLLCMVVCRPWISRPLKDASGAISTAGVSSYQTSFLIVAVFYLVFALPAFRWLQEPAAQGARRPWTGYVTIGFRRVGETLSHLRQYKQTAKYILASLFFTDGITTVVSFAAIYATTTIGFTNEEMVWLFLVMNVVAFPGALVSGYVADGIGAKRTLILSLFLWIGVVVLGFLATTKPMFWVMACGAAIGMGGTQAVGRSFMAQITPPSRESEFFGFYVLSGKFASMFGPLLFGTISRTTGSQRMAVLSLLPFFLLGLAFLFWIDEKRARQVALPEGTWASMTQA
jgi:UMF1 family MFS transporter